MSVLCLSETACVWYRHLYFYMHASKKIRMMIASTNNIRQKKRQLKTPDGGEGVSTEMILVLAVFCVWGYMCPSVQYLVPATLSTVFIGLVLSSVVYYKMT